VQRCIDIGIDGIFFATKCANPEAMTSEEYNRFGRPYDLRVLEASRPLWFNILHVHGLNTYDLFDYPVTAYNYHDRRCERSLQSTRSLFPGVLIGGINEMETLLKGPDDQIRRELKEAIGQLDGEGLIIGPGCVIDTRTPKKFLHTARRAVGK
jgi:uroporphyrinogen decarboxylase